MSDQQPSDDHDPHEQTDPEASLPPGSDVDEDGTPGMVREQAPYDDAPGQGKFAPGADNPAP